MEHPTSLYQQRRYAECENACRGILLSNPQDLATRHTLVLAIEAQTKLKAALKECETLSKMVTKPEDFISVNERMGIIAANLKEYDTAANYYQQVLKLDKDRHKTWIALGSCQYELNQYEASTASLLNGINHPGLDDTSFCEALYFITENNPAYTFSDVAKIVPRAQKPVRSAQYYFTIGTLLERERDYPRSLSCYDTANQLLRERKPYNYRQEVSAVQRYINVFDEGTLLEAPKPAIGSDSTPIFIVGMPRTGSSLLEQLLGRHTKISPQGENKWLPEAFTKYLGDVSTETEFKERCLSKEFISAVRTQYLAHVKNIETPYFTDKLPGNFAFMFLINLAFPEALIIKTARERLPTIWSCYKTPLWHGHSYTHSIAETAAYFDLVETATRRWRSSFGERFIELNYETFVKDSAGSISEILSKLDLEIEEVSLNNEGSDRIVHTASKNQVTQPVYQDANDSAANFESLIKDRIRN